MEPWTEIVFLAFDWILFSVSYFQYKFYANTLKRIKEAEELGVNPDPESTNFKENGSAIVKGSVTALTNELVHSFNSPQTTGVLQKITVTEHNKTKNAGFWLDRKRVIQEITNTVPFALKSGKYVVEVSSVRDSFILDLETVAAKFEPSKLNTFDFLFNFISGVKPNGFETVEEMLKEGTALTGIGELKVVNGMKVLLPPSDGSAYIFTVTPVSSIVKRIKLEESTMRCLLFLFGTIGVVLIGLVLKRGCKFFIRKMNESEVRRRLEEARRERRNAVRNPDEELPESMRCVACLINPREIIIIPCGHICLCENCSDNVINLCPMCRGEIESKMPAFF